MRLHRLVPILLAACNLGPPETGDGVGATDDTVDTIDTTDTTDPPGCEEIDADTDGTNACDDCDDSNAETHPGAAERCDGVDNNCDLALDPAEQVDDDGDGAADCAV